MYVYIAFLYPVNSLLTFVCVSTCGIFIYYFGPALFVCSFTRLCESQRRAVPCLRIANLGKHGPRQPLQILHNYFKIY